jgi:hypothetical protein
MRRTLCASTLSLPRKIASSSTPSAGCGWRRARVRRIMAAGLEVHATARGRGPAKLSATAFIWVEHASPVRLDSAEGQFDDYDDDAAPPGIHEVHDEVEAYISAYNARRRLDQIVYLNAYDG